MIQLFQNPRQRTAGPADITFSLDVGQISGWINKNVFKTDGSLVCPKITGEETHFLTLQWPNQSFEAFSDWHAGITIAPITEAVNRAEEFTTSTADNLGENNFEMLKVVMERCHKFKAHLLEVTSRRVKLGHTDVKSALEAMEKRKDVEDTLNYLMADTEYQFCDVTVSWEMSITPGNNKSLPAVPVQKLSSVKCEQDGEQLTEQPDSVAVDTQSLPLTTWAGDSLRDDRGVHTKMPEGLECILLEIQTMKSDMKTSFAELNSRVKFIVDRLVKWPVCNMLGAEKTDSEEDENSSALALPSSDSGSTSSFRARTKNAHSSSHHVSNGASVDARISPQNVDGDRRAVQASDDLDATTRKVCPAPSQRMSASVTRGSQHAGHRLDERRLNTNIQSMSDSDSSDKVSDNRYSSRTMNDAHTDSGHERWGAAERESNASQASDSGSKLFSPSSSPRMSNRDSSSAEATRNSANTGRSSSHASTRKTPEPKPSSQQETPRPSPDTSRYQRSSSQPSSSGHHTESRKTKVASGVPPDSGSKIISDKDMPVNCGSDTDSETTLVKLSVKRAYLDDEVPAPKANSFDTILCLDVSESMKNGGAFEQMKKTTLDFIDGVEDVVTESGIEENIGLVTFGGRANVVQNLTNDFSRIRDKIEHLELGGNSPFVEALLVSMAAFVRKGGIVSVSGEWEVRPRIIFISDGFPTESCEGRGRDVSHNMSHVRVALYRTLTGFKDSDSFNRVHPVVFIPVGAHADTSYMKTMAELCDGCYVEPQSVKQLCLYFREQETVGKILVCLKRETEADAEKIQATVSALMPDLTTEERERVVAVVQKEHNNPNRTRTRRTKPNDVEYVFEDLEKVKRGERIALGARVVRGPDWQWDNQDSGGPGTVINQDEKRSLHWVAWDRGGYNRYAFSEESGYHLQVTDEHPRLKGDDEPLQIGMTVKKGPDWKLDGTEGQGVGEGMGVIIRKSESKEKLLVRWPRGARQICNWSPKGPYEVEYCDPHEGMGKRDDFAAHKTSAPAASSSDFNPQAESEFFSDTDKPGLWHWRDADGQWQMYDEKIIRDIEAVYRKRPATSCLIKRDDKTRRVMFKKRLEKVVDGGVECEVRRTPVLSPFS